MQLGNINREGISGEYKSENTNRTNIAPTAGGQAPAAAPAPTQASNVTTSDPLVTPPQRGRSEARDRSRSAARIAAKAEAEAVVQADHKEAQRLLQIEKDGAEAEETRRKKLRTGKDGTEDMDEDSAGDGTEDT